MELVEELKIFKPNQFNLSDKVNKLTQENAEAQEIIKMTNQSYEKLKDTHSKTIAQFDESRELQRKTSERLNSLQLQYDLKMRDLNVARDEVSDSKHKLYNFTENSTTAIEKLEIEYKQTIQDLQLDFSKVLADKDQEISDIRSMHDRDKSDSKANMDELNRQIKSLVGQLAAFDNIDVDSYSRLKARQEVLNQNLEIFKDENKTLKYN